MASEWLRGSISRSVCATLACSSGRFRGPYELTAYRGSSSRAGVRLLRFGREVVIGSAGDGVVVGGAAEAGAEGGAEAEGGDAGVC